MRGRPVVYEDAALIDKAQTVFWEKGYSATSLKDLLSATGAGAGSFYNTFKGGKKEVFKKAIQQRREAFTRFRKELEQSGSPVEMIKDFFRSIATADKDSHLRGCIIANTVVEMTYVDESLEAEAVRILKEVEHMFTGAIEKEQQAGNLKTKIPANILGKYLITFWCGLNTLRRIYPDKKILSQQIEMQLATIS